MATFTTTATGGVTPIYLAVSGTVSQIGTVALIATPGANLRLVLDYFKVQLSGATTTAGTILHGTAVVDDSDYQQYAAVSFGAATPGQEMRLPANTPFVFSAAGTSLFKWSARYFTENVS